MSNTHNSTKINLSVHMYKCGGWNETSDLVTKELPYTVSWRDHGQHSDCSCELWAWPQNPAPLALGHVLLDRCPAPLALHREAKVEQTGERAFHVTVGKALPITPPLPANWTPERLFASMDAFIRAEGQWDDTGCFHRAGIHDIGQGRLLTRSEDIGRHNCIDRLAGWSVLNAVPLSDKALLISARLTSSLCAKALRAGFHILVSRSAVTSAAVAMCMKSGATLVGFARTNEQRFTVFTDPAGRLGKPLSQHTLGSAPV